MIRSFLIFTASCLLLSAQETQKTKLFNGRNLEGWNVLIGKKTLSPEEQDIFTVNQGVIHVYPTQEEHSKQPFAGLVSKESYENYHLIVEYKWGEKKFAPRKDAVRDAGVLIHVARPHKIWPSSIELQIQEGDTGDLWIIEAQASSKVSRDTWGYHPNGTSETRPWKAGQSYAKFARSFSWEKPGWNKVELIVRGDHAIFKVNDHIVNEAIDCRQYAKDGSLVPLTKGHILLQAEGAEIFYRNVTLTPFKKAE